MTSLPLASVVIPTYNRQHLLAEAIESCLAQAWRNIEIIVIDDGSTDGTAEYIRKTMAEHSSEIVLRYVWQENSGASAARNRGLALAQGEYVQFLDSDDLIFPDKLIKQIAALESAGHREVSGCGCYGVMGRNTSLTNDNVRIGIRRETPQDYITLLASRIVHGMPTPAPLWRRSFLVQQAGWRTDISLGDDLEYHVRLLCAAEKFEFIDDALFFVREHDGPRLSDVHGNRRRVLSSIRSFQAVVSSISASGNWSSNIQTNVLRTLRTTYANVLEFCDDSDVTSFEKWLSDLSRSPKRNWLYPTIISIRKFFGARTILWSHRLLNRIVAHK